ncbi:ComF family protein [Opitutaceae bacterium TAV4]|nr:ComF family protein [Opitutaceae bacterium TAV4]RRK00582.1 ComF family protein [Opitutaceae bacterium TAV3]
MTPLRQLARGLVDVVFPPRCVHCHGLVEHASAPDVSPPLRHVCAKCARFIRRVQPPHCTTCGHPFFGEVEGEHICEHCEGLHPEFNAGRTAVLFRGPARSLVIELKYQHGLHVLNDIETIMRGHAYMTDFLRGATLVPVPLHPRKERERGYNQSALLARCFARAAAAASGPADAPPVVAPLLRRVIDTQTQTNLDRAARRANLKNAFALVSGASINPAQHYILIDDVFTTGSTLNACARVLRRAGALNLDVVTFGHG